MRRGPPTTPPEPEPISTHEHEWRTTDDSPYLEDFAAIFNQTCQWAEVTSSAYSAKHDETFHGYGAECEQSRTYRMEMDWIEYKRVGQPDIRYLGTEAEQFRSQFEDAAMEEYHDGEIVDLYDSRLGGYVIVESENWRIRYDASLDEQVWER